MRLARYLAWRCIRAMILLAGASFVSFALLELAPGDYFDEILLNPSISQDSIDALRAEYGLNQSMLVRYARWCASTIRGDWGFSIAYQRPAGPLLGERAKNTLLLTAIGTVLTWVVAIAGVVWAAVGKYWRQYVIVVVSAIAVAIPDLVLILALTFFASKSGWLPSGGMTSISHSSMSSGQQSADLVLHLIVPVAALVFSMLPIFLLHTRGAVQEVMSTAFITSARASGIPRLRLVVRHAIPAASGPLITLAGLSAGGIFNSSLVIEVVTGWPGLGNLLLQSVMRRDPYVVLGAIVMSTAMLLLAGLMTDLLLFAADPRIRR